MPTTNLSNGNDKFTGSIWNDIIFGNDGHDTILGGWGYDQIYGGKGNDVLDGSLGNDLLMGQDGDDWLSTSDSAEMHGGIGNDTYRIIAGDVFKPKLVELANEGIDTVQVSIWRGESYTLGANLENLSIQNYRWVDMPGPDYYVPTQLIGNGADNVITGGGFGDALYGMGGNDTLRGGADQDELFGGTGDDLMDGGTGADRMEGGTENDTYLVESTGDKVVELAGQGIDTVKTTLSVYTLGAHVENLKNIGTSQIFVGTGNGLDNGMTGGANSDYMFGGDGKDSIFLGAGKDFAWGGTGNDSIEGQAGDDMLSGGLGADYLAGGTDKDDVRGDGGDDVLSGGTGDDRLSGGTGLDWSWGGSGKDTFVFLSTSDFKKDGYVSSRTSEAVYDFGAGDRIDLSAIDANAKLSGNQAFTFFGEGAPGTKTAGSLWTVDMGDDLMLLGDVNGDGWQDFGLLMVGLQSLSATDFVL